MSSSRPARGQRPLDPDQPVADRLGAGDAHFAVAAAAKPQALAPPSLVTPPAAPGISPNFTAPVSMTANEMVTAGTVLYAVAQPFMYNTTSNGRPALINFGTLWSSYSTPSFTPTATIVGSYNFGAIYNYGLMVAQGTDTAEPINVWSTFDGLVNGGSIYALADRYFATVERDWDSRAVIVNSGVLAALSLSPDLGPGTATARVIYRHNGGRIENHATGQILAEGARAVAITMDRGHQTPFASTPHDDIVNHGLIEARSLEPLAPSIAIKLYSLDIENLKVLNAGTIRSDIAILIDGQLSIGREGEKRITNLAGGLIDGAILLSVYHEELINRGRIEGDVDMAGGSDLVLNDGAVIGTVDLGDGADIWRSFTGTLDGAVFGGAGADSLTGAAGADMLNGEAGADVIRGGGGADQLNGGADADVYRYGAVDESTAAAFDTIAGFVSGQDRIDLSALAVQSVSIQADGAFNMLSAVTAGGTLVIRVGGALTQADLILSNAAAVAGTANADELHATAGGSILTGAGGNDTLIGGAGDDRLDGGTGADILMGGAGDDVYTVDFTNWAMDLIWEFEGEGRDTVEVYHHDYFCLPENVENVVAFDPEYSFIYGNGLSNRMTGNAVTNTFIGGGGDDLIDGGGGADRLQGDSGGDRLTGGSGADRFIYTLASDSMDRPPRSDGEKRLPDFIADFTQGEDKIDLQSIDADGVLGFNAAFTFIGTNAFSHQAGQLRYEINGGFAHLFGDTDGDGAADLHIVTNAVPFAATDFIL